MATTETGLESLFAAHGPATARLGKALRARLRARLPGLAEIVYVYGNQGALLISYSPTGLGYGGVCSLGLHRDGVKLHFGRGALLSKADPGRLLRGTGKTVRHVPLEAAADLDRPEIEALMAAALRLAKVRPVPGAEGAVILKADGQKARARRTARSRR